MNRQKMIRGILTGSIIMALNIILLILFTGVWSDFQTKGLILTGCINMIVGVILMIEGCER